MQAFITICASFSVVCVAVGWLIKIAKGVKKPVDDVNDRFKDIDDKLDNDNKRLKSLDEDIEYISKAISVLMRSNLVILGHLSTNNNTSEMAAMEKEIQDFLINSK